MSRSGASVAASCVLMLALAAASFGAGCYSFDPTACQTRCDFAADGSGAACPSGLSCFAGGDNGVCAASPEQAATCGAVVDAAPVDADPDEAIERHRLAAKHQNTCLIDDAGALRCWGSNSHAQVSRATPSYAMPMPTQINEAGIATWQTVSVGNNFICGIGTTAVSETKLVCWGNNGSSQLGVGDAAAVVNEVSLLGATPLAVAAGDTHACAIGDDEGTRRVYCWGGNNARQLGSPAGAQSAEAVVVPDVDGATAIDSGDAFSCATVDSILHCWGSANYYEASSVGGAANDTAAPAQRFDGAVAATGLGTQFGCAISDTGEIGCWGINGRGEYGNNTILVSAGDELVTPLGAGFANAGPWRDLDAAFGTACAVSDEGQVWCWGSYNDFGERGRGDTLRTNQNPTEVNTLPSAFVATEVAVGSSFACALGAVEGGAETVYCWGDDTYGQQAHGESALDADGASVPLPLHRVSWDLPVAGVDFTCARAADARGDKDIFCWGANESGQSNPSSPGAAIFGPSLVEHGLASFPKALVAGTSHVCAANGEGGDASICWGDNGRQQLGNSDTGNHFFALDYAAGSPAALAAGPISSCRLIGASWECWGGDQDPAIDVALAPFGVVKLGPGFRCGLGTFDVDKVRCQGENGSGQLGNGTNDSAVFIDTANGITGHGLSVGATAQTCAIVDGAATCWGENANGEAVPGQAGDVRVPTDVGSLQNIAKIVTGENHTCALNVLNEVYCWGDRSLGQSGMGPALIRQIGTDFTDVTAGRSHTCGVKLDGSLLCWGLNDRGQLGQPASRRPTAAPIAE